MARSRLAMILRRASSGKPPAARRRAGPITVGVASLVALALAGSGGAFGQVLPQSATGLSEAASTVPLVFADVGTFGTSWSYNDFSPNFDFISEDSLVMQSLAPLTVTTKVPYEYMIATGFSINKRTVTIHIRKSARWQNGKPVTSTDVLVTQLIGAMEGPGGFWQEISSISTPNSKTVRMVVKKGYAPSTFVINQLTGITPVPAFRYEPLLPKGQSLQSLTKLALEENETDQSAPGVSKATKFLEAGFKKVENYSPKAPFGDGPYRLVDQTTQESHLVKSPTFYDAKKVHVQQLDIEEFPSVPLEVAALEHGQVDYEENVFTNSDQVQQVQSAPDVHVFSQPANHGWDFYFNYFKYPFNDVKVRQAIAYASDIRSLAAAGTGRAKGVNAQEWWPAQTFTTGYSQLQNQSNTYLTASTKRALNSYPYSPSKATALLKSAGFHKVNGQWKEPDGKPFTMQIDVQVGNDDLPGIHLGSVLKSFGINAQVNDEQELSVKTAEGNRTVNGLGFLWGQEELNPLADLVDALNIIPPASPSGYVQNVPGLGRVNMMTTLQNEVNAVPQSGSKFKRLVNLWARYFNRQMLFMTYGAGNLPYQYNSSRYVGWPSTSTSLIWQTYDTWALLSFLITSGDLRPKA